MEVVCFIVCDSSFFLLCSLLSFIVVHYAHDCSCTCMCGICILLMSSSFASNTTSVYARSIQSHVSSVGRQ